MPRHLIEWDRAAHLESQFPSDGRPQVAFAGRSNVGKSSLLNRLFGQRLAGVSRTPGKTRSINFYRVDDRFYLVDLPGYGYAKRSQTERAKFSALIGRFLEHNDSLRGVAHLVDMRHDPSSMDIEVSRYLRELQPAVLTVLTKADKLSRGAGASQRQKSARTLSLDPSEVLPFSAEDGRGKQELWTWILEAMER
jgi:GTP-binding protein